MGEFNNITEIPEDKLESTLEILKIIDPENYLICDLENELNRRKNITRDEKYKLKYLGKYVKAVDITGDDLYCKVIKLEFDEDSMKISSNVVITVDCDSLGDKIIETHWPDPEYIISIDFDSEDDDIEIILESKFNEILEEALHGGYNNII